MYFFVNFCEKCDEKTVRIQKTDFFSKKLVKLPDLARSYLFQVTFATLVKNRQTKEYDLVNNDELMIRARKVEFNHAGTMYITFDEFQDFKVHKILNRYNNSQTKIYIELHYYDSKLEKELYVDSKGYYVCGYMKPLNLDTSRNEGLKVEGLFREVLDETEK